MRALTWLLIGSLAVCVAVLFYLREHGAHRVTRWVLCPRRHHRRSALVEFEERRRHGRLVHRVRYCPLRGRGELCDEACVPQLAVPRVRAAV